MTHRQLALIDAHTGSRGPIDYTKHPTILIVFAGAVAPELPKSENHLSALHSEAANHVLFLADQHGIRPEEFQQSTHNGQPAFVVKF